MRVGDFIPCPVCGKGEMIHKKVEEVLQGGNNTAIVEVGVEECNYCGERLFTPAQIRIFEEIKEKLASQKTGDFQEIGKSYRVNV